MTPDEALMHQWILEGLPPKVLAQHKKILGIKDEGETMSPPSISQEDTPTNRTSDRNNGWMKQRKSSLNSKTNNEVSLSTKEKYAAEKEHSFSNTENVKGVSHFFNEEGDNMTLS